MSHETIFGVLSRADQTQLLEDLNDDVAKLCARVRATKKKGKITLTIEVSKLKTGENALEVKCDFATKLPTADRNPELYFVDEQGGLSRKDPRQPDLPGTGNIRALNQ